MTKFPCEVSLPLPSPRKKKREIVLGKSPRGVGAMSFQTCFLLLSFFLLNKNCPGNQDLLTVMGKKKTELKGVWAWGLAGNSQGSFRRIF